MIRLTGTLPAQAQRGPLLAQRGPLLAQRGPLLAQRGPAGPLSHQLVEDYLAAVGARLPGPARERAGIIAELRGGLLDAADAHRDAGLAAPGAAAAAIGEFGDPGRIAAAFGPGLALTQARRVALTLLVTGPMVGLLWGTAATASHIGGRHVPPWQWVGALPGSLMVFPLAAAIAIAVWTALFTIAATGRATRWLPDRPRLAPGTAAVAGFGAVAADLALFMLLASQLTVAPGTLATVPAAAAAMASATRLVLAGRAARRCLTTRAALTAH
ncbi:MAG: permease prefix domain 1-containing protein [Streptosporangiaceae bacterium]